VSAVAQRPARGTAPRLGPRVEGAATETGSAPGEMQGTLGVVFCGGESRRMGADKALLEVRGRTLLEGAIATLTEVCDEVLLASGPEARYGDTGRRAVVDRVVGGGPLAGLEAALAEASERGVDGPRWVAVLACDMPRAEGALFRALVERAEALEADACLLETPDGVEPLLAVYRPRCLGAVRRALEAGERRMVAFHRGHGPIAVATLRAEEPALASNLNTPDELQREKERSA